MEGVATAGQIDTTTVYGAIAALSQSSPGDVSEWAWDNLVHLLATIITCNSLTLAPVPRVANQETDKLGRFLDRVEFAVRGLPYERGTQETAVKRTSRWVRENQDKFQQQYSKLKSNTSFQNWLDWNVEYVWPEHCKRLGGLADKQFNNRLCAILNLRSEELEEISQRSTDADARRTLIADSEAFRNAKDVYVMSILLRGVYYDYLSKLNSRHFVFHQVRQEFLPKTTVSSQRISFTGTRAEICLFHLLAASLFRHKNIDQRFSEFASLAEKGRNFASLEGGLIRRARMMTSEEAAIEAAKRLFDVSISPIWLERTTPYMAATVGTVTSTLSNFLLEPWCSILVGIATAVAAEVPAVRRATGRIPKLIHGDRPLRDLVNAPPGRIIRSRFGGIKTLPEDTIL